LLKSLTLWQSSNELLVASRGQDGPSPLSFIARGPTAACHNPCSPNSKGRWRSSYSTPAWRGLAKREASTRYEAFSVLPNLHGCRRTDSDSCVRS
jgi:hypothetical protein